MYSTEMRWTPTRNWDPCHGTKDNAGAAVAMVTSETMYMEGVPPTQAGLEARMVAVSKRRGEQDTPMSVARKEPRKPQGGRGRQGARRKGGNPMRSTEPQVRDQARVPPACCKEKTSVQTRYSGSP